MQSQRHEKRVCEGDERRMFKEAKTDCALSWSPVSEKTAPLEELQIIEGDLRAHKANTLGAEVEPVGAARYGVQTLQQREARGDLVNPC